jgi:hypothetical protein
VWKAIALFDAAPLEETLVRRALSDVRGLALLGHIYISMHERLLDGISEWSLGPFWLWFAGGTGGMCPCCNIGVSMTFP